MSYFISEEDIKHEAYRIHQEKSRQGINSDADKDWLEAKAKLELQNMCHRGSVGS